MSRRRNRRNKSYHQQTRARYTTYTSPSRRLRFALDPRINDYNDSFVTSRRVYVPTYTKPTKINKTTPIREIITYKRLEKNNTTPLPYSATKREIQKATICARRKTRTEVIHALNHAGKGGQKKPNYTQQSKIKC